MSKTVNFVRLLSWPCSSKCNAVRWNGRAYWCCPARRLFWGCRSPSASPLWSPRSPALSSCQRGWCRWSSPRTPDTSVCPCSGAPRCSLPWGGENSGSLVICGFIRLLISSEVCVYAAGLKGNMVVSFGRELWQQTESVCGNSWKCCSMLRISFHLLSSLITLYREHGLSIKKSTPEDNIEDIWWTLCPLFVQLTEPCEEYESSWTHCPHQVTLWPVCEWNYVILTACRPIPGSSQH